jgi:hypothetical protein
MIRKKSCLALLASAALALSSDTPAQEANLPQFPFGTPVIVLPVQSTQPLPDGGWPGLARTEEEALRAMDAELEFALGERRGAEHWVLPSALRGRLERNPMLDVHPDQLAYQGLLEPPDSRDLIYDPLHSDLRALAALFNTRYLILPLEVRVEPVAEMRGQPAPDSEAAGGAEPYYHAVLLLAMIDIRTSTVVWHGEVGGAQGPRGSGALLAKLAQKVAKEVAAS